MSGNKERDAILVANKLKGQNSEIKQYSHEQLMEMATIFHKSGLLPAHIKSVESCYVSMRWAMALQIDPFLGLRDIFVIDNIPSLRTEAAIALVEASGFCENIEQYFEGSINDDTYTAVCKTKRKDRKEHVSKFSVADAKLANLWGKKTPSGKPTGWITYPSRMLMYRAVGFALRDIYPDVLRGARLLEETRDYADYEEIVDNGTNRPHVIKATSNSLADKMQPPPED